jgi:hypothetical protein
VEKFAVFISRAWRIKVEGRMGCCSYGDLTPNSVAYYLCDFEPVNFHFLPGKVALSSL